MSSWKIGPRIAGAFAVVTLIAAALGLFPYNRLTGIDVSAKRIVADSLPGVYAIGQIQSNVDLGMNAPLQYALADASLRQQRAQEFHAAVTREAVLFSEYEKTITQERDRELFGAMKITSAPYWQTSEQFVQLTTAGKTKEASDLYNGRMSDEFKKYGDALTAEVDWNKKAGDDLGAMLETTVASAQTGILISIGLALCAAFVVSLWTTRSITRPVTETLGLVQKVTLGDLTGELQAKSTDELGQMIQQNAAASEHMASTADELSGQAETLQSAIAFFRIGQERPMKLPIASKPRKTTPASTPARSESRTASSLSLTRLASSTRREAPGGTVIALDDGGGDLADGDFTKYLESIRNKARRTSR